MGRRRADEDLKLPGKLERLVNAILAEQPDILRIDWDMFELTYAFPLDDAMTIQEFTLGSKTEMAMAAFEAYFFKHYAAAMPQRKFTLFDIVRKAKLVYSLWGDNVQEECTKQTRTCKRPKTK